MKMAPCKDCPKKGCGSYHDKCSDYLEYKRNLEREKQQFKEKRDVEVDLDIIKFDNLERLRKYRTRLKQR